jgi:polar amino acid transport system substrate-binding protein
MMKKFLTIMLVYFAVGLPAIASDKLVLLTSADNPPYEFTRAGEIIGFDVDLAKIIAGKLGRKLVIKDMPFSSIIPALRSGQGDLAMAAITPTESRRENVDFSIPYQNNTSAIVLVKTEDFSQIDSPEVAFPLPLLENRTVAVQLGTHHETDIRAADIPGLDIKRYDNIGTMVAEIIKSADNKGIVYALIIGTPEAKELIKRNGNLCYFSLKFSDSFAVALPKKSPLKGDINRIIQTLLENDKLSELEIKWDISQ